jgi:hypothetical protein
VLQCQAGERGGELVMERQASSVGGQALIEEQRDVEKVRWGGGEEKKGRAEHWVCGEVGTCCECVCVCVCGS